MTYVFVYGTLKKGKSLHFYLKKSQFVGKGYIKGYDLYLVDWYPAVVKGKGKVFGEVYKVDEETLSILDKVEEEGILYKRVREDVFLGDKVIQCWIYVYLKDTNNLIKIESGKF